MLLTVASMFKAARISCLCSGLGFDEHPIWVRPVKGRQNAESEGDRVAAMTVRGARAVVKDACKLASTVR